MTFISIDGGDGVGKGTQVTLLEERLPRLYPDRSFVFTREPGGTPFGEKVRELILSPESKDIDGQAMFGLFAAARADHVRRVIRPALADNKVVISDRFVAATWAYQVYGQENPISEKLFAAYLKQLGIFPNLTILLDMEPEASQGRVARRKDQDVTHFDERKLAFHVRLREGYDAFARTFGGGEYRIAMVEADQSIEDVHTDIMLEIEDILG